MRWAHPALDASSTSVMYCSPFKREHVGLDPFQRLLRRGRYLLWYLCRPLYILCPRTDLALGQDSYRWWHIEPIIPLPLHLSQSLLESSMIRLPYVVGSHEFPSFRVIAAFHCDDPPRTFRHHASGCDIVPVHTLVFDSFLSPGPPHG